MLGISWHRLSSYKYCPNKCFLFLFEGVMMTFLKFRGNGDSFDKQSFKFKVSLFLILNGVDLLLQFPVSVSKRGFNQTLFIQIYYTKCKKLKVNPNLVIKLTDYLDVSQFLDMIIKTLLKFRPPLFEFSKKMKSKKQMQTKAETINVNPDIPKSIYQKNKCVYIVINAKPNSKVSQIQDISDDGVGINIAAPPKEGQANQELISFLSDVLSVKKSNVDLDRGGKSRSKLVVLSDTSYTAEQVYDILKGSIK